MGSVSRHAVSHSPVPVIVVRQVAPLPAGIILTWQARAQGQEVTQQTTSRPKTRSIRRIARLRGSLPQSVQVSWKCGRRRLGGTQPAPRFGPVDTKNSCIQPSHIFTALYGYASLLARQVSKLLLLDQLSGIRYLFNSSILRQGKNNWHPHRL
jgi:hypothetical protein